LLLSRKDSAKIAASRILTLCTRSRVFLPSMIIVRVLPLPNLIRKAISPKCQKKLFKMTSPSALADNHLPFKHHDIWKYDHHLNKYKKSRVCSFSQANKHIRLAKDYQRGELYCKSFSIRGMFAPETGWSLMKKKGVPVTPSREATFLWSLTSLSTLSSLHTSNFMLSSLPVIAWS